MRIMRILVVLMIAGHPGVSAQQQDEPRFDVVSIKANPTATEEVSSRMQPPRYTGVGVTAMRLVTMGFLDVTDRIEGAPGWMERERYDVQAMWSGPTEDARLRRMMRNLVLDHFNLRFHVETQDAPAYALVRARADGSLGPRIKVSPLQDCLGQAPTTGPGAQATAPRCGMRGGTSPNGGAAMMGLSATMARFARDLSISGRPVIDRTGLSGAYDFELEFSPGATPDSPLPSLFTALQEQLGLRLEPATAPVKVMVIETAERPREN